MRKSHEKKQVWSCGGGRQSCAIAALIVQGRLPKPDISVISDTGRERFSTFPYLQQWVIPALTAVGVELNIIEAKKWAYLGTEYIHNSGGLKIPAYTLDDGGNQIKLKPDCSGEWKRDAINHWLGKVHGITRSQYVKWIGFSASPREQLRALKMMRSKKEGKGKSRFPLIELWLKTEDCLRIVKEMGWPEPKVSACWMCPNLRDDERLDLSDEEQAMANQFDDEMRQQFPNAFIHKSFKPLREAVLNAKAEEERPCESGLCFV